MPENVVEIHHLYVKDNRLVNLGVHQSMDWLSEPVVLDAFDALKGGKTVFLRNLPGHLTTLKELLIAEGVQV